MHNKRNQFASVGRWTQLTLRHCCGRYISIAYDHFPLDTKILARC